MPDCRFRHDVLSMGKRSKQFPILAVSLLVAAILLVRLFTSGLSWPGVVALVLAFLWFGFEFVRWLMAGSGKEPAKPNRREKPDPDDGVETFDGLGDEDIVSLVYFLTDPRSADEAMIRSCVASALGVAFDPSDPDSDHFVMRFTPPVPEKDATAIEHYMVRIPDGLFAVLLSSRPYIEDPASFARDSIRDKRLRNAVENHKAWLSVDLMDSTDDPDTRREAYRVIGRILATLAGPDCLAVYSPELQRCNEFDLSLLDVLSSDDPLEVFDEPTFEPIIEISDDNPKMAAAVAEAKSRWPEFVDAFAEREDLDDDRYIVKAEFREGSNCEYMWISVRRITQTSIDGILMNDPHELIDTHRGAEVSVGFDRLNDWLFPGPAGEHVGGFTLDVLAEGD